MASGDLLIDIRPPFGSPPSTLYATLDVILGASTPVENFFVYDFNKTTVWYMDFRVTLPSYYAGGGLTSTVRISADTSSGTVGIGLAFRTIENDDDLDTTAHTYDYNDSSGTVPSTIGKTADITSSFTDGADMDSLAAGGEAILRIRRNTSVSDNADGDMNLHWIKIVET